MGPRRRGLDPRARHPDPASLADLGRALRHFDCGTATSSASSPVPVPLPRVQIGRPRRSRPCAQSSTALAGNDSPRSRAFVDLMRMLANFVTESGQIRCPSLPTCDLMVPLQFNEKGQLTGTVPGRLPRTRSLGWHHDLFAFTRWGPTAPAARAGWITRCSSMIRNSAHGRVGHLKSWLCRHLLGRGCCSPRPRDPSARRGGGPQAGGGRPVRPSARDRGAVRRRPLRYGAKSPIRRPATA